MSKISRHILLSFTMLALVASVEGMFNKDSVGKDAWPGYAFFYLCGSAALIIDEQKNE